MDLIMISEFTICLHCGCSQDVVNKQIEALQHLENKYKIYWNNRIDRHPEMYESYSELINHSIITSPTEWVILINDRTNPTVEDVEKMLSLLQSGFACVLLYNVGFMGFAKELVRKIGWWDQRFTYGGWEDRDWVWRIYMHDLALYESLEAEYDMSWKSPLNVPGAQYSTPHWNKKYKQESNQIIKMLDDESYSEYANCLGDSRPEISSTWKSWKDSVLNVMYDRPTAGPSGSTLLYHRPIVTL